MLNPDIAIDFGTSYIRIYINGKGIVINEPSVMAVNSETDSVEAMGRDARPMTGRTSPKISVRNPFVWGRIADYPMAEHMVTAYIKKIASGRLFLPSAYISSASGLTNVEKHALLDIVEEAGIRKIYFVDETAAAAVGADLDIFGTNAVMVVDLGASKTSIGVYSSGNLVAGKCIRVGGNDIDEAAIRLIKLKYSTAIGRLSAEELKIRIGCASPTEKLSVCKVSGADVNTCMPVTVTVSSDDMLEAAAGVCGRIADAVIDVMSELPLSALSDLSASSIVLTGGGAKLQGITDYLRRKTQLTAVVADRPDHCAVNGTAAIIELQDKLGKKSKSIVS